MENDKTDPKYLGCLQPTHSPVLLPRLPLHRQGFRNTFCGFGGLPRVEVWPPPGLWPGWSCSFPSQVCWTFSSCCSLWFSLSTAGCSYLSSLSDFNSILHQKVVTSSLPSLPALAAPAVLPPALPFQDFPHSLGYLFQSYSDLFFWSALVSCSPAFWKVTRGKLIFLTTRSQKYSWSPVN